MARSVMVFVHSSDELYGADRMLLQMLSAVPESVTVEVWLPDDLSHPAHPLCHELEARGISVRHLSLPILRREYISPKGLIRVLGRATGILRELRRRRPDVVYCATSATFLVAPLARLSGVDRVIGHVHEIWGRTDQVALTAMAAACHPLLAISTSVRDSVPRPVRRRVRVVPNGVPDPGETAPNPTDGPLTYAVASRWNRWKGHRTLIAAWNRAGCPGQLLVLGGPPPAGEAVDVRELAAAVSDPASIRIVGEVADPIPYMKQADVIVVPSDQPEPFGLVAIEAFGIGRPVIGSSAGGLRDIITDETGWLFPPGDVPALANLLSGRHRDEVVAAGHRARARYEEHYTETEFGTKWRTAVFDVEGNYLR